MCISDASYRARTRGRVDRSGEAQPAQAGAGSGTRDPGRILDLDLDLRSDQRSNLSGLSRVAPPVLLGIEVIDFCFYGKSSHVTWCHLCKPAQARAPMHA